MKKLKKDFYRRPFFDLPALIVVLFWVGIWFLWPDMDKTDNVIRRAPGMTIVYAGEMENETAEYDLPIGAVLRSRMGDRIPSGAGDVPDPIPSDEAGKALFLQSYSDISVPDAEGLSLAGEARSGLDEFHPRLKKGETRQDPVEKEKGLIVTVAPELKENGFSMPEITPEDLEIFDQPWQITVYVEMGENGRVRRLFLESGPSGSVAGKFVLGKLRYAGVSDKGGNCEGRVKISYGLE